MYMAPEIVRRRDTDPRVDIFAFGVSAYELLTFELPWPHAEATGKGALSHDSEKPVPILELRPRLNPQLARSIMQCMEPRRESRPSSLDDFLRQISRISAEDASP
jgi:serine/threonine protein kinase